MRRGGPAWPPPFDACASYRGCANVARRSDCPTSSTWWPRWAPPALLRQCAINLQPALIPDLEAFSEIRERVFAGGGDGAAGWCGLRSGCGRGGDGRHGRASDVGYRLGGFACLALEVGDG